MSVCVCKGAWGRRSSPEFWGSEGCTPFSLSDTPPIPCQGSHSPCPTGPWSLGLAGVTEGLPVPGGSGCCRGATSTPCLAHSWVRLQEVAEMGWGPPCVSSPAVAVVGQGGRALSQPCSDLKLKVPGEMPVLAPGPLHGQVGGGGLGPSDPQAQRSPQPLCRWGWSPGWEPSVAGRGALHCN